MSIKKYFSNLFFLFLFSFSCCTANIKFFERTGSFTTREPREFDDYLMGHSYDWRISEKENVQKVLFALKNATIYYQLNGEKKFFLIDSVGECKSWRQLVSGNFSLEVSSSISISNITQIIKGVFYMNGVPAVSNQAHQLGTFAWNQIKFDFSALRATEEWKRKTYQPTQTEIEELVAQAKLEEEMRKKAQRESAEREAKRKELNDLIVTKTQSQIDDISRKKSAARKAKTREVIKDLGGYNPENFTCLTGEALEKYHSTMSIYDLAENAKCDLEIEHIKLMAESEIARGQQELIDGVKSDSNSQHPFDRDFGGRSNHPSDDDYNSSSNYNDPKDKNISIKKRWIFATGVLIAVPLGLYFKKNFKRKKKRKFAFDRKQSKKGKKSV